MIFYFFLAFARLKNARRKHHIARDSDSTRKPRTLYLHLKSPGWLLTTFLFQYSDHFCNNAIEKLQFMRFVIFYFFLEFARPRNARRKHHVGRDADCTREPRTLYLHLQNLRWLLTTFLFQYSDQFCNNAIEKLQFRRVVIFYFFLEFAHPRNARRKHHIVRDPDCTREPRTLQNLRWLLRRFLFQYSDHFCNNAIEKLQFRRFVIFLFLP